MQEEILNIYEKKDEIANENNNISKENLCEQTNIEMKKKDRTKKRKKIKIKAYCSKCYKFFENGPFSKLCRTHLEKNCNLVSCQKYNQASPNKCIRKFPNINSANRHTHCLTYKDIKIWDPRYEIQKCLGSKREPENEYCFYPQKDKKEIAQNHNIQNNFCNDKNYYNFNNFNQDNNIFNNTNIFISDESNYFSSNFGNNISNNNVGGLIDGIDQLNFGDNDSDIQNIFYEGEGSNNKEKNGREEKDKEKEENKYNQEIKENINEQEINSINNNKYSKKEIKDIKTNKQTGNEKENLILFFPKTQINDESIDEFFEKVQKETNIPNNTKKKLLAAFKKKGILNVKILLLFYKKYKNWDFLIKKFKNVSSQIEGVALCIEYLLKV